MLTIGPVRLENPAVLAPLAGISDLPFRLINRRMGCGLAHIEMISAHGLAYANKKTLELLRTCPEDRPLALQIFGRDPEMMRRALDRVRPMGFPIIDLNAACPVKKVVRRGEGAALLKEPSHLGSLLRVLVSEAGAPVTVKIRIGWDAGEVVAADVARIAEDAGCAAVYIHGRTRAQMYAGRADYAPIAEAVRAVRIPVLTSGDIMGPREAKRAMDETGCAGVVMARGALGNPWIFPETAAMLSGAPLLPRPSIEKIAAVMSEHFELTVGHYGPGLAHRVFRKCFIWYTKGIPSVRPLRLRATSACSDGEMRACIEEFRSAPHEHDTMAAHGQHSDDPLADLHAE